MNTLKGRELWRPLAPSILSAWRDRLFERGIASETMTVSARAKSEAKNLISASLHIDETARPQLVDSKMGRYYELLTEFYKVSGIPGVINTSFNSAGEPIVCTPTDAIATFLTSGLDALVVENIILTKPF